MHGQSHSTKLVISAGFGSVRLIRRCSDRKNEKQHSHPMWSGEVLTRIGVTTRVPVREDWHEKLLEEFVTRQRPEEPSIVIDVALA